MNDVKFLICPVCGDECGTLPAHEPTEEIPYWYFLDGAAANCQCGARVMVSGDTENDAELVEVE